jgi:AraC-like DNA-binding protein
MDIYHHNVKQEITPILPSECFVLFEREKHAFDFPLHFHAEYELNCIIGAKGSIRHIDKSRFAVTDYELVLTGPNLCHGWESRAQSDVPLCEKTLQFPCDLLGEQLLSKNLMSGVAELLRCAQSGISFSESTCREMFQKLPELKRLSGTKAIAGLLDILEFLSLDKGMEVLLPEPELLKQSGSADMLRIFRYVQHNYCNRISIADAAEHFNMSESTFGRLIKKNTGTSFIDYVIDYRLSMAARLLKENRQSISEVAYQCGFSNLSNFNRLFKKAYNSSPGAFKKGSSETLYA